MFSCLSLFEEFSTLISSSCLSYFFSILSRPMISWMETLLILASMSYNLSDFLSPCISVLRFYAFFRSTHSASVTVQSLSRVWLFVTPWTAACQASLSITIPGVYTNYCPLSRWCHPTISSSVVTFSSCLQSFPASVSFQMSQFFTSGGQSIGVSASASVLPMTIQDWFPLGWTGWISLQSKGLSRVFSNTTLQKHQFFGTQLSL